MADKRSRTRTKKSSTLYWRRDRSSEDAKQPDKAAHEYKVRSNTTGHPQRITLRQLCSEDKRRVRQLIQELASTGVERDKLEERLREERGKFRELLASATQQCQELSRERNQLEIELAGSQLQLQAREHIPSHPHPHTPSHTHMHTHPHSHSVAGHTEEQYLEKPPLCGGPGNSRPTVEDSLENSERLHNAFNGPPAHVPVNFDLDCQAGGPRLAAVGSTTHPPMKPAQPSIKSTVAITATHCPITPTAPGTSASHPPLSVASARLRPLASTARALLAPSATAESLTSSTVAHPLAQTDVQPSPPKAVNVESVLDYPVQNPHPRLYSNPAQQANYLVRNPHPRLHSNPVQQALLHQTPVPSLAVSYAPIHSSSDPDNSNVPGGHLPTSYPRFTMAHHPAPSSDLLPLSQLPTSHQRPHQSVPTPGGCGVTHAETETVNCDTSVQWQPRESHPQSPSTCSSPGTREFAERYRPESSTPPVDEWSSLPPATPQLPQDGDSWAHATWDGVSHRDQSAPESRCRTSQPHAVLHRDTGTQTASTEFESVPLSNRPSSTLSASHLPSTRSTNTDTYDSDDKPTRDTGVQTAETEHFLIDSRQPISDSGDESSFISHSSSKQTAVQVEESKSLTRDGGSRQEVTSVNPVGHSRIPKASLRAEDGHPRALSPILPSKLVPTSSLCSEEQAENTAVNEAHLEAMMATALLNAQDTVSTIRGLARLNRSLVSGRGSSSTGLTGPSPERGGLSLTGGGLPDRSATRGERIERSLSPSELLAPGGTSDLVSETLGPQGVPGLHSGHPAARTLVRRTDTAASRSWRVAAVPRAVLSPLAAQRSRVHSRGTARGRVRRRLLETGGTEWDNGGDDDDSDIIEELFFIT